ncbi:MAG TPA: hypothetical protein VF058_03770 [Actinomycetota bacterium]
MLPALPAWVALDDVDPAGNPGFEIDASMTASHLTVTVEQAAGQEDPTNAPPIGRPGPGNDVILGCERP